MKKRLLAASVLFLLIACNKDKFQTKPQISVRTITDFVPLQGRMEVTMSFTDKEGDLGTGKLIYLPVLLNKRPLAPPPSPYLVDSSTAIPAFTDKSNGDIKLSVDRNFLYKGIELQGGTDKNDTILLKILVRDRGGNLSDTLTTKSIVIQG